jgi:hypothetical protein
VELWGLETPDHLLAEYARLSDIVAHLGLCLQGIGQDRLAPDPVVVRLGAQPSQRCRAPYLRVMETAGHQARPEASMNLDLLAGVAVPPLLACWSDWQPHLGALPSPEVTR